MEFYVTKEDNLQVVIDVKVSSPAQIDSGMLIYAYEESNKDNDVDISTKEIGEYNYKGVVDKRVLKKHNILVIRTDFLIDDDQLINKKTIVEKTSLKYLLNSDSYDKKLFYTNFEDYQEEFYNVNDENSKVFHTIKKIKITFMPNLERVVKKLIKQLNSQ